MAPPVHGGAVLPDDPGPSLLTPPCLDQTSTAVMKTVVYTTKKLVIVQSAVRQEHKFINGITLNKTEAAISRREVRSHVAKVSAAHYLRTDSSGRGNPKARQRRAKALTWPVEIDSQSKEEVAAKATITSFPTNTSAVPAAESTVARLPFIPLVVENYLQNLAVAVPELDGPDDLCLLKKSWFPMVIHSSLLFQVIVLFSASHYAAEHKDMRMGGDILYLKQLAITELKKSIGAGSGRYNDVVIATAAKMGSYEAIYGTETAYHAHMGAVSEMVKLRGGLKALGLNGFLGRLLQFIDTNAAFLLNCELHLDESELPKLMNPFLPNPSRFIGAA